MFTHTARGCSADCWLLWECAPRRGEIVVTLVNGLGQVIHVPLDEYRLDAKKPPLNLVHSAAHSRAGGGVN